MLIGEHPDQKSMFMGLHPRHPGTGIVAEIIVFGAGVGGAGSAVLSDRVFNAGIALPLASAALVLAFFMGVTQMPSTQRRPWWRNALIAAELIAAVTAGLLLLGKITF